MIRSSLKTSVLVMLSCACGAALAYTPGIYEGRSQSLYGETVVSVEVTENSIKTIYVLRSDDTKLMVDTAADDVIPRIVKNQSVGVDATTGASFASLSILSAVKDALSQARGDMKTLTKKARKAEPAVLPDEQADIVVVGGGAAGLATAIEAAKAEVLRVVLLEKQAWVGGSAALSGGSLAVGGTELNRHESALDFSTDEWVRYFEKRAGDASQRPKDMWVNPVLLRKVGASLPSLMNEYLDAGMHFTFHYPTANFGPAEHNLPGADNTRGIEAFKDARKDGNARVFSTFLRSLAVKRGADVRTNSRVTGLVVEDGEVRGVRVKTPGSTYVLRAKKVILATGGISQNRKFFESANRHVANIEKCWTYANAGATGDGFTLTAGLDPQTTGYGFIAMPGVAAPHGFESSIGYFPAAYVYLWVDGAGNRFTTERTNFYYHNGLDILNKAGGEAWAVTSPMDFSHCGEKIRFADWLAEAKTAGVVREGGTIGELAQAIGADPQNLQRSFDSFNAEVADGHQVDVWSTPVLPLAKEGPYYAVKLTTSVIATMHSLKLDDGFHVVGRDGKQVANLFAVGELTYGNFFFEEYGATGTAIAIGMNSGALAAREAIKEINAAARQ